MLPAARLSDATSHGGSIVAGFTTVLIGDLPAARQGDPHLCPLSDGGKPHVGGVITGGDSSVLIGDAAVARISDLCGCGSVGTAGASVPASLGPSLSDQDGDGTRDSVTVGGVTVGDTIDVKGPHNDSEPGLTKVVGLSAENQLRISGDGGNSASITHELEIGTGEAAHDLLIFTDEDGRKGGGINVGLSGNAAAVSGEGDLHADLSDDIALDAEAQWRASWGPGLSVGFLAYKDEDDGMGHVDLAVSPSAALKIIGVLLGPLALVEPTPFLEAVVAALIAMGSLVPTIEISLAIGLSNKQCVPGSGAGGVPNTIITGEMTVVIGG